MKKSITAIGFIILLSLIGSLECKCQWAQADGMNGGPPDDCAVIGKTLFLSSPENGVFRSTDLGIAWLPANNNLASPHVSCLTVNGNNLFAGTSDMGVFSSTDMGNSWSMVDNGLLADLQINDLAISGDTLFAAGKTGIFLTINNGTLWTSAGLIDSNVISITSAGSTLIAITFTFDAFGSDISVFRFSSQGSGWQDITFRILSSLSSSPAYFQKAIALGSYLFMPVDYQGIVRSTDGGFSWDTILSGEYGYSIGVSGTKLFANGEFAGWGQSMFSTDSGISWLPDSSLPYFQWISSTGNSIFAVAPAYILQSTDSGISWDEVNTSGLTQETPNALFADDSTLLAGSHYHGMYRSTNYGTSWHFMRIGDTSIYSFTRMGNRLLAVGGQAFSSSDNGLTWDTITNGLPIYSQLISLTTSGPLVFAANYDSVYRSSDSGRSWRSIGSGFPTYPEIHRLASNSVALFAGTYGNGVFRSEDNGTTWTAINANLLSRNILSLLATDYQVFAGTPNGVFVSIDNGTNWTSVGLQGDSVYSLTMTNNALFAMTSGGVFFTTSNGSSWTDVTTGLKGTPTTSTICGPYLFAGATGVWRRSLSEMIVSNLVTDLPVAKFSVTIQPNPISQFAIIHIASSESQKISVAIVNALGVKVAELFDGIANGSEDRTFIWSAGGFPSSTYWCEVRAGNEVALYPVLLLK